MKLFKNPFEKAKKRSKDDAKLVGELLGPEEEAEMREAMGEGPESHRERDDSIRLSEEEEAEMEKEIVPPDQRWKEYVEWAENFGKSDEWVGETFIFNDDGGVEVEGDLNLAYLSITRLPGGLTRIGGGLILVGCEGLTSLKNLPPTIGGFLDLTLCTGLTSLKHLPSSIGRGLNLGGCTGLISLEHLSKNIGGDLSLKGCTQIKDISKGLKIEGEILLKKYQTELKANAEAKGYKVRVR